MSECRQCHRPMNPADRMLGPVCLKCCKRQSQGGYAMTHTPGPWDMSQDGTPDYAYQATIHDEKGERVATAFTCEANAQLIAAAPDLLTAAQLVSGRFLSREDMPPDWYPLLQTLLQAIDKATGASVHTAQEEGQ